MKKLYLRVLAYFGYVRESTDDLPANDADVRARMLDEKRKWNARELAEKRNDQHRMAR